MPYQVIGWDVGIKNLAYSVVSIQGKASPLKDAVVKDWQIVNLVDPPPTFNCFQCDGNAKYFELVGREKQYGCGHHIAKERRKVVPKKKIKRDLHKFGTTLFAELEKRKKIMLSADAIVIENQPCLQNPFMKSIQIMLFSWFVYHGQNVSMTSATNKLKVYRGDPIDVSHIKSKYSQRKKLGILQCKLLLSQDEKSTTILEQNKAKCDDLCDAYLLACYKILTWQKTK